jgi:aldehyde dehydrogenase (NAD+)
VERSVADSFTEKLITRAQAVKVGNGLKEGVTMGPAVNKQELDGNFEHIAAAQAEGAKLLWGGQRLSDGDLAHGYFMSPAVIGM